MQMPVATHLIIQFYFPKIVRIFALKKLFANEWYFFGDFLSPCKILQYDWNVFGLEVTANLGSLTPNEVAKMGFTRGSLMRGLVGSPPSRNVEKGQKSGKPKWYTNGDQKWPPEAFMGTLLQVKSSENHSSTHTLCSLKCNWKLQKFQFLMNFFFYIPNWNFWNSNWHFLSLFCT